MWRPLLIVCVLAAVSRGQQQNCPSSCLCIKSTVRCMYMHLQKVPQVAHNTHTLDLRFNKIKEIQPGAFANLKELITLLLNNNQITRLQNGVFSGLDELKHLYLYKNRIKDIESDVFKGLSRLEQLHLHFNDLVTIHPGTFNNLGDLSRLFLQHNKLKKIPTGAFKNLVTLERLRLDSNALVCDCDMAWLVKFLKEMKDTYTAGHCQQPVDMQGKSLTTMTDTDFHCRKPEIKEEPHDVEIPFGGTVYFTCKADGDPQPNISWLRNSHTVDKNPRYSVLDDGTLMISYAVLEDVGSFECVANNSVGHTKSRSAVLRVGRTDDKPKFAINPEDYYGRQGQQISLHCTATGQPSPNITWSRDGKDVRINERFWVLDNGTLTIQHSRVEDTGSYQCSASNYIGTIQTIIYVKVVGAPILTESLKNESARAGDMVLFRCLAQGQPSPTVNWYKEGQLISHGGNFTLLANGKILRIERVQLSDAGRYTCIARNTAGQVIASAWLSVEDERREAPVFQDKPFDLTVDPGATIKVPCSATGHPRPEIEWRKNNAPIDDDTQHKIASGGSLYIYNITEADAGVYECTAVNEQGKISAKATVNVIGAPILTESLKNESARAGDMVLFRCFAQGQPSPTVNWYKEGQLIARGGNVALLANGQLLRIKQVKLSDAGQYTCIARNTAGQVIAGAWLSVEDERREAPVFQDQPFDLTVDPGATIEVPCSATGHPRPEIEWRKNSAPIDEDTQHKIASGGSLYIYNITEADDGVYECTAVNEKGKISAKATVTVRGAPILTESLKNESARAGDMVLFRCFAQGQPSPIVNWYKEGQLISHGGNVDLLANGQILQIKLVELSDAGEYMCIAHNTVGQVIAEAWLSVEDERREAPVFQDQPFDLTVDPGATIEVPCSATGHPRPKIEWRKNSVPIDEDTQHKITSGGSLYIYNITEADAGIYECAAVNEKGKISAKATVTVRGMTVVAGPGDRFVQKAHQEAQNKGNKAVNDTLTSLFSRSTPATPGELSLK